MKLKKILKILPAYERVRVWGNDEERPLYDGFVKDLPYDLINLKLSLGGDDLSYMEIRYNCSDIEDHVAIFVEEK